MSRLRVWDLRSPGARALDGLDARPDGGAARLLAPLGAVYAGVAARLARTEPLPPMPPSVGIGNLRVGGTGKTPLVADLASRLRARGVRVGILTRGHRSEGGGDEPQWLRDTGAAVEVDPDRRRGRERLLAREHVDLLLLDDGLQTRWRPRWSLALGLERDRARPPRCVPAGPAREGWSRAQARADAWAWRHDGGFPTGDCPEGEMHFRLRLEELRPLLGGGQVPSLADVAPALAVSGLARPQSFETDLSAAGVPLVGSVRFDDHWSPEAQDLRRVEEISAELGVRCVVCPEKNAARLKAWDTTLEVLEARSVVEWWGADPLTILEAWWPG